MVVWAAMIGGFCAGALIAWAWLLPMSPERRDAFLQGVSDVLSWRILRRLR